MNELSGGDRGYRHSPTSPALGIGECICSADSCYITVQASDPTGGSVNSIQNTAVPFTEGVMGRAATNMSWGPPAGLKIRCPHDENLVIFRKASGINFHRDCAEGCTLEEGRKSAIGIYKIVITTQTRKCMQHAALTAFLYTCYFAQIVIGAGLTVLGAGASTE
ncbi:hypothetical protein DL769_006332 [Monosporascus sp. CRB-8-3]|nr:hypothetical protein DL769_006332 [Monosporascus sp. CRB-8-3]